MKTDIMSTKIIYHGSKYVIKNPTLFGGKASNDYGHGFYCTESMELACEWACQIQENGIVNRYEIETKGLTVLDLTKPQYSILNWIAILLKYRFPKGISPNEEQIYSYILENFLVDLTDVDIIIGYRADDSYFSFARDFVRNTICVRQLASAMKLGKLGKQIVIHSEKAFKKLHYINSEEVPHEVYYAKRYIRDLHAKKEYLLTTKHDAILEDDIFIMDIIRKKIKNDDPRIQ